MKNLDECYLNKKNILVRVDLNVPYVNGKITDKSRIKIIKPSIAKLRKQKNKIFLISHFGRPNGEKNKKYSLKFICKTLKLELKLNKIFFLSSFDEKKILKTINEMNFGDVCLFENIRFYEDEEKNDLSFVKNFCKYFDAFVNDAFSASHRNHSSIVGIPKILPSYAGYGLVNEIINIDFFINNPKKPNLAIIGGSKISTKLNLLKNLLKKFNAIVIGGAMANTFLYAKGFEVGNSLCEKNLSKMALHILNKAKKYKCDIILPVDVVCSKNINDDSNISFCDIGNIPADQMAFDVGAKTVKLIFSYILKSNMILWNGPLGVFEKKPYDKSSIKIANFLKKNSKLSQRQILAGGGDTVAVINIAKASKGFSYISNAGGAFLEWLEGKKSPGVNALLKNKKN